MALINASRWLLFSGGRSRQQLTSLVTEFSDTFDRADAASLGTASGGGTWTEWSNGFTIVSNRARQENESACAAFTPTLSSSDMFAEVTVASITTGISSFVGPAVRCPATIGTGPTDTDAFYILVSSGINQDSLSIRQKDATATTLTTLVSGTRAVVAGDVLRLEALGDTLRAYHNGQLVLSYTGATLTSNTRAGLRNDAGAGAVVEFDGYTAGSIAGAPPPQMFSDTFDRADAATLGTAPIGGTWTEWTNGFTIVSNQARQENESACAAFTAELASSNHYAEATVASFTSGISSFIGPIVRAPATIGTAGAGTGAFYLLSVNGSDMASFTIRRKEDAATTLTTLASATAAIAPGDRLRLEAEDNFLRAYLNGTQIVSYASAALTSNKRCGLYNDAGAGAVIQWDNYTAGLVGSTGGGSSDPPLDPPVTGFLIISTAELAGLPTSGTAYTNMVAVADAAWPTANLNDLDNQAPAKALAAALVYARTGNINYRDKVVAVLATLPNTTIDSTSRSLAWGRQLAGWAMCADLVGYTDATFKTWIGNARTVTLPGHSRWQTIKFTAEDAANNGGAWNLASYLAISRYVGDTNGVLHGVAILKGILGNTGQWSAWTATADYDPTWVVGNPTAINFHGPGINPVAGGTGLDGGPAEDAGRSATAYPTMDDTGREYCWEAVSGWMLAARLAKYAGFTDVYTYQSSALLRAGQFLQRFGGWPSPFTINYPAAVALNRIYSTTIGTLPSYGNGRQFGYTDWLTP